MLGVLDYFVYRGGKLIHPRARDDDRVAATVCFLGDAKEFAAVVLTKFDVKMLTLDLQLPRFLEKKTSLQRLNRERLATD